MFKKMKILLYFMVPFVLMNPYSHVSALDVQSSVLLKINEYYIIYTAPKAPYMDQQNRLMIPLRSISELIGADVKYDSTKKTARIAFDESILEVTIDSSNVRINGVSTKMDTKPVLNENSVFVPLKFLIEVFKLDTTWDKNRNLVSVKVDRDKLNKNILHNDEVDGFAGRYVESKDLQPTNMTMTIDLKTNEPSFVSITVKNVGDEKIYDTFIHMYYLYERGIVVPDGGPDELEPNETYTWKGNVAYASKLKYILISSRFFDNK